MKGKPRVGVSACLLGERVRYDGGHKRNRWIAGTLARLVEFVPVCPEVDLGLGTPRPTIRLEETGKGGLRLVEPASGDDLTVRMERYAAGRVRALARAGLDGYILKAGSPSCGPERVKVHAGRPGPPRRSGRGIYAAALLRELPLLPVTDEGRLGDTRLRENFLLRVLARRRLRDVFAGRWTPAALLRFHGKEEPLLLAHDPGACANLRRLAAAAGGMPRGEVERRYIGGFLRALAPGAKVRRRS